MGGRLASGEENEMGFAFARFAARFASFSSFSRFASLHSLAAHPLRIFTL